MTLGPPVPQQLPPCVKIHAITVLILMWVEYAAFGGHLIVEADDLLTLTSSPPQAVAILDGGVQSKSMAGKLTVEFLNLSPGIHTVEVQCADLGPDPCNTT